MSPSSTDHKILSYHDEILYESDLSILQSPTAFINDRLISFYFTHLSISLSLPSSTLLLPPSISFLLSLLPNPDPSLLSPISLSSRSLILFPVNDNPDPSFPGGGTHWSLLVYDRRSDEFVHHDSLAPYNRRYAMRLYEAVKGFVGGEGEARFVEGPTPQQRNGYDCGLYVMAVARVVCEWKWEEEGRWFGKVEEEVTGERVGRLRGDLLELIRRFMEEAGNAKSLIW